MPSPSKILLWLVSILAGGCGTTGESSALVSPPCTGGFLSTEELSIYRAYLETGAVRTVYDTAQAPVLSLGDRDADPRVNEEVPWATIEASLLGRSGNADCLNPIASIRGFQMAAKLGNGVLSLTRIGFADRWAYFQFSLHRETITETFGVLERKGDDGWSVVSVKQVGREYLNVRR
jgi:hypothetical protein